MGEGLLRRIRGRKARSDGVLATLLDALGGIYYPDRPSESVACGDMSSFVRGTDLDRAPDLDPAFLEVRIGDQVDPVIDAGLSFEGLLANLALDNGALPAGAWENLVSIARR